MRSGGLGLNLIGTNRLIFVDPHYNPQMEAQAADRVYRLKQEKTVQIYRYYKEYIFGFKVCFNIVFLTGYCAPTRLKWK